MELKKNLILLFFFMGITSVLAQEKTISGTVTDDTGPLPGVSIIIKGTTVGAETDFDGNYSLKAKIGDILIFSFVGMTTIEKTIGIANVINVVLTTDNILEEVVVIGYGQQSERKIIQNVAVIKEAAIEDIQALSPQDLLQGQASGVQIVSASGVLGAASVIRVRGVSSLTGGSNPLIVVDGVPLDDQDQTTANGGNDQGLNPLSYLSTEDIASFTVLKDAAATSLYGTRGSNGVILITTKKGKLNQETKVTVGFSTSINEETFLEKMMNIEQFADFTVTRFNLRNGTNLTAADFGLDGEGFNWLENVTRQGVSTTEDINISGGSETSTFYFGLNHADLEGFIIGNNLEKTGARVNLTTQANDWLKAGINLSTTVSRNDRISVENSTFAPLTVGFLQTPDVLPRDANGDFVNTGFIANVLAIEALDRHEVNTTKIIGNAFVEASLFEGLKAKIDYGIDRTQIEENQRSVEVNSSGGFADNRVAFINRNLITLTLNYNRTLDDHTFGLFVGTSYEETKTNVTRVQGTGFLSDNLLNITSASTFPLTFSSRTQNRLYGQIFSRVNYDYQGKYLLEASFRRDGSSRFGKNNQFGNFWAVAGGWIISDEAFMEDGFFDYLSIRASYGTTGNDRLGDFPSLGVFQGNNYNGLAGLIPTSAQNNDLQWEETATLDIGFKSSFLNNRIQFNVNYYDKQTDNLLINVPLPRQTGIGLTTLNPTISQNAGEIENKGFEFDLTTVNFRTDNFEWTTKINLSTVENTVLSLPGANVDELGRQFIAGSTVQRAVVGESANSFYLVRYVGVNPQTGESEWLDVNGNITNSPTPADRKIVGDAQPDFYGGITNTFKYKAFDLNIFMNYSYGNDVYISGIRFTDAPIGFGMSTRLLNYWEQPGDNAYFPRLDGTTSGLFRSRSTNQLKDASFLRLKNVTIGYTLPKKFLENMKFIDGVRIYATGTNLATIKKDELGDRDPEVTDSTDPLTLGESFFVAPQSKSYTLGIRVTF